MATIVNFKPAEPSARPSPERPVATACEIILFPGVRYERWAEATPPEPEKSVAAKKRRAKKPLLEMVD